MTPSVVASGGTETLEEIARLIQLSLTPVFLLASLASLLNVFASRLARVADRVDQIAIELETAGPAKAQRLATEQHYQRRRTRALDIAVVLGTFGGVLTCTSVLVLFVGSISGVNVARLLFAIFGGAIVLAIGALAAFGYEMLLASRGVRRRSHDADEQRARPLARRRVAEE
ncbi:DUF2721 domain-containing protein [uncultured Enterovirga sp.]|uniref:DUF2721 domain-containing protein n=1 Tax=uncultured Enterovirga sp. TaxID=2026352 RepID=UPI0035C96553